MNQLELNFKSPIPYEFNKVNIYYSSLTDEPDLYCDIIECVGEGRYNIYINNGCWTGVLDVNCKHIEFYVPHYKSKQLHIVPVNKFKFYFDKGNVQCNTGNIDFDDSIAF